MGLDGGKGIDFLATKLYNCSEKGVKMNTDRFIDQIVRDRNGYLRVIDVCNNGVPKWAVMEYVARNAMEKVAPGVYASQENWGDRLYLLQLRNRKIIFSHETALYIHNLSDREPFSPVVSVARGYNAKHLRDAGVIVHTVRTEWVEMGLSEAKTFEGNTIRVYDKERCLCDAIKGKERMDIQVFQKAVTGYFSDRQRNIHKLMDYAETMGIADKVRGYAEVLL